MKKGDKVYCINNYNTVNYNTVSKVINTKGKYYTITHLNDYEIYVSTNYDNYGSDKNFFIIGSTKELYCFENYFISLNEARKQKLLKLNETR